MTVGKLGEELACDYLCKHGLLVVEKNFRLRLGEVDLIMRDGETVVFVEVKFRTSNAFGTPLEAVTLGKQRKIKRVAQIYLQRFTQQPIVRFDVVGIMPCGSSYRFEWVKGAFE